MKLLLDTCVWGGAVQQLANAGHDVVYAGHWAEDPGDADILARAHAENRVLVTLDKDFGELAIVRAQPHAGIVRLVGIPAARQATVCAAVLERYQDLLTAGSIVTVEQTRVRVRTSDAGSDAS